MRTDRDGRGGTVRPDSPAMAPVTQPIPLPGNRYTVPGNRWDLAPVSTRTPSVAVVVPFYNQHRQLDLVLEPILLKLQLPMAMNLREEARHHRARDGIDRHRAILAALETNDAATVLTALADHGHLQFLELPDR